MPSNPHMPDRPFRRLASDYVRWIGGAILCAAAIRLLAWGAFEPEPYDPYPRSPHDARSPEPLETRFPVKLSERLWMGMTLAEAKAAVQGEVYWSLHAADVSAWRFSPREQFPKLPESMTWYETNKEGASGGIKLGFGDGKLIYRATYGYPGDGWMVVPEASAEFQSDRANSESDNGQ
jgi:hypothetical protein